MDIVAGRRAVGRRQSLQHRLQCRIAREVGRDKRCTQFGKTRLRITLREDLLPGLGIDREILAEEVPDESLQVLDGAHLDLAYPEDGPQVGLVRQPGGKEALGHEVGLGPLVELVRRQLVQVDHVHVGELLLVKAGIALVHRGQVKQGDNVLDGHLLAVVLRGPSQEAQEVDQGLRQKAPLLVLLDQGSLVALGHLARAILLQDERDMRIDRHRGSKCAEQFRVLARVREVILAADDMGHLHGDVIHHVYEVEHGVAVRAHDDEILLLKALHPAADRVLDDLGLARYLEIGRPILLVGPPRGLQALQVLLVDGRALALPVRAVGAANPRTLIPVHSKPAQARVDDIEELLAVAGLVGVLDPQDEDPTGMPGIEPVEERRAGAADMEEPGGAGGKADSDL